MADDNTTTYMITKKKHKNKSKNIKKPSLQTVASTVQHKYKLFRKLMEDGCSRSYAIIKRSTFIDNYIAEYHHVYFPLPVVIRIS